MGNMVPIGEHDFLVSPCSPCPGFPEQRVAGLEMTQLAPLAYDVVLTPYSQVRSRGARRGVGASKGTQATRGSPRHRAEPSARRVQPLWCHHQTLLEERVRPVPLATTPRAVPQAARCRRPRHEGCHCQRKGTPAARRATAFDTNIAYARPVTAVGRRLAVRVCEPAARHQRVGDAATRVRPRGGPLDDDRAVPARAHGDAAAASRRAAVAVLHNVRAWQPGVRALAVVLTAVLRPRVRGRIPARPHGRAL